MRHKKQTSQTTCKSLLSLYKRNVLFCGLWAWLKVYFQVKGNNGIDFPFLTGIWAQHNILQN